MKFCPIHQSSELKHFVTQTIYLNFDNINLFNIYQMI
jgi:hypothetical protein